VDNVGYCGYNCGLCAARSDDAALRRKLVEGWRRYFGHQHYTADNVKCDGCRSDGEVADKECRARPCARKRGVTLCAECAEFPCAKMKGLMASGEGMLLFGYPATKGISAEDYNLCMRQFESMPALVDALVKAGKLPRRKP
jgi:hypothetical protein